MVKMYHIIFNRKKILPITITENYIEKILVALS